MTDSKQRERPLAQGQIEELRQRIDKIDRQLVGLLNDRARSAMEIGSLKHGLGIQVYQPNREGDVLRQVRVTSAGPLSDEAMTRLFEQIIDEVRRLEDEGKEDSDN